MRPKNPSTPRQATHGRPAVLALLLFVLVAVTYLPATRCAFIWDDDFHLTQNPCIVGPLGMKEIWTSKHASLCPLVLMTFWMEHRLWGLNPVGYHVVNVLLHAGAALVLWRVLHILKVRGAWLGAALWALHPVQVASVAWISEMKNTQSGLFFLLAILFYCKWRQREPGDERRSGFRFYYGLTLVFGALALASKSSTVVLPLVLGLCAWWMERRWSWRRDLRELAPLLLLSVLAGVQTLWTQKLEGAGWGHELALGGLQRVLVAGRVPWFYLGKLVWPHPLIIIYPRWEMSAASAVSWLPVIVAVAVTAVLWRSRKAWDGRGRALWLGWVYFGLALLPVLGLAKQNYHRYSFVADHFQYLASMGPLALAGAGINVVFDGSKKARRWPEPALCSVLLLVLGGLTWRQCAMYRNQEALWTATLSENPSCWVAHNNLGGVLQQKGLVVEAQTHYQEALKINPDYADAHNNLGTLQDQKGQLVEAQAHFEKALEISPDFAEAHSNLGTLLEKAGRLEEAMAHYQKASDINPEDADAHYYLGNAFRQKGQLDKAVAQYLKALEIRPNYAEAHNSYGNVFMLTGRPEEAGAHYQRAFEIKPDYAEAHNNLGLALQKRGLLDEAMAHYQEALRINPRVAAVYKNTGNLLQQRGRLEEAATNYEKALEINPADAESLNNLAYVLATSEDARLRDGARAVELAERASRLTGGNNPNVLGTLAAAQAEAGSFPAALETVQLAIRIAEAHGNSGVSDLLQQHLKLYQAARPLRAKP